MRAELGLGAVTWPDRRLNFAGRWVRPKGATMEVSAMSGTEPLLSLRGINKSFGAVQVLRDVDLEIFPGKVTALVGDNGAGKSTLIKCIAGIHPFDDGEMSFDGRVVHVHGPKDANALGIEVVYQDLALCDN